MPSVHGICFDEGQSGHCGIECEGFLTGECDVYDEIIENCQEELIEEYVDDFKKGILKYQTKLSKSELDKLKNMFLHDAIYENFGYKIE